MHKSINLFSRRWFAIVLLFISSGINAQTKSQAEAETERLMNSAVPFAQQMLSKHGEFFPYGQVLDAQGKITFVAGYTGNEQPSSSEVIRLLKEGFIKGAKAGEYKATALVYDARVPIPSTGVKSDAIVVALNHKDNYSILVYLPYKLEGKKLVMGELFWVPAANDIFPK